MTDPMTNKSDVQESNDRHIKQDHPNVPGGIPKESDKDRDETGDQRHVSSAEKPEGQEDTPSQMPTEGKAVSEGRGNNGQDTLGNP